VMRILLQSFGGQHSAAGRGVRR